MKVRTNWLGILSVVLTAQGCGSSGTNEPAPEETSALDGEGSSDMTPAAGGNATTAGAESGGTSGGDAPEGSGGTIASGEAIQEGASGGAASSETACGRVSWPAVDPASQGPFETITETMVGPLAGEGEDGAPVGFTIFRPATLGEEGRCHPVVTWGNGTGSTPTLYKVLLNHLASHGFIVIGSDSPNVAQGDPPPMVAGVTWLIEENEDPQSPFYGKVDTENVGATGHSQGGFATTNAGNDASIKTIAPLCGATRVRSPSGPAIFFCGGEDDVVGCDGIQGAFDSTDGVPAMFANYLTADHANWVTFRGTEVSPMETAVTAWMRVHLMNDTALRGWFYGESCGLCGDSAWEVAQRDMNE